jgi:translation elongation factor Ts
MAITASLVKELRERTGAGMMECKKALTETNGDIEAAIENMRKSGQAKAAKKAGRTAADGVIVIVQSADGGRAAMVEVNCETDFVAKDDNFKSFADAVGERVLNSDVQEVAALMALPLHEGEDTTIEEARQALIQKIRNLEPQLLKHKPGPGRWSILEDFQHLVLAEQRTSLKVGSVSDSEERKPGMFEMVLQVLDCKPPLVSASN